MFMKTMAAAKNLSLTTIFNHKKIIGNADDFFACYTTGTLSQRGSILPNSIGAVPSSSSANEILVLK